MGVKYFGILEKIQSWQLYRPVNWQIVLIYNPLMVNVFISITGFAKDNGKPVAIAIWACNFKKLQRQ